MPSSTSPKRFVTFVGNPRESHPSFIQAQDAGLIASWVRNPRELILDLARTPFTNLIVFDVRHASELQCAVCHDLTAQGYRIVCIGAARPECLRNYIPETGLLSVILAAVQAPPPPSSIAANRLEEPMQLRRVTAGGTLKSNACPECDIQFPRGWLGFASHWRAQHSEVMPYEQAWQLLSSGEYTSPQTAGD